MLRSSKIRIFAAHLACHYAHFSSVYNKKRRAIKPAFNVAVGGEGFEPTKPKQQIYSLSHLTTLETSRLRVQK